MKYLFLTLFIISLQLASFGQRRTSNLDLPKIKLDDYIFEPTPNNLNNVGYIFAIKDGQNIPVVNLQVQPVEGNVAVESKSRTKDVAAGMLIRFMGSKKDSIISAFKLNNLKKVTTTFNLENPTISRIYLISVDTLLDNKREAIRKALSSFNLTDAKLYMIFETIRTNKLTYEFNKSNKGMTDFNLAFKALASTSDSIKWNNTKGGKLSFNLKNELNVFYKVLPLEVFSGANGVVLQRRSEFINKDDLNTIMVALLPYDINDPLYNEFKKKQQMEKL